MRNLLPEQSKVMLPRSMDLTREAQSRHGVSIYSLARWGSPMNGCWLGWAEEAWEGQYRWYRRG